MELSYSIYAQTGEELKRSKLEFVGENKVVVRQLFDKFSLVPLTWYTIYNYNDFTYVKLDNTTMKVVKEGVISKGVWRADQVKYKYEFIEYINFKDIKSIHERERVELSQNLENRIKILSSSIFKGLISQDYIQYLPLSSFKLLGIEYEGYGIVCEKRVINRINNPKTMEVTEIIF